MWVAVPGYCMGSQRGVEVVGSPHLLQGSPSRPFAMPWREPCRISLPWRLAAGPSWGEWTHEVQISPILSLL